MMTYYYLLLWGVGGFVIGMLFMVFVQRYLGSGE